jgi:hypothetical protein
MIYRRGFAYTHKMHKRASEASSRVMRTLTKKSLRRNSESEILQMKTFDAPILLYSLLPLARMLPMLLLTQKKNVFRVL